MELLDWLSAEFMERGWSMKQVQRLHSDFFGISASSQARPELQSRDPYKPHCLRARLPSACLRN